MSTQPINVNTLSFEIVRNVTLPFFVMPEDGTPSFVKFITAFAPDTSSFSERVQRRSKKEGETEAPKKPMDIANIVNLQTGEEMRLVAHEVLINTFNETYKDATYVNKLFRIVKTPKKGGRGGKYYAFDIAEIRLKEQSDAPQGNAKPAAAKR